MSLCSCVCVCVCVCELCVSPCLWYSFPIKWKIGLVYLSLSTSSLLISASLSLSLHVCLNLSFYYPSICV